MTRGDLGEIGAMSGPIFIEQLAMALIATLISMLVKSTGLAAVAAVNLLNTLNLLFQQTYMSIGVAVTVVVAQHRGRGDLDSTGKAATQSMSLALMISTVMAVLCFLFMGPILSMILGDSEPLVYEYSRLYLTYCILSLPFMSIYSISTAAIRGSGKPSISLVATLVNNGAYAAMAIVATQVFDFGLLGVSIAMLASRVLAAGAGIWLIRRGNENLHLARVFTLKLDKAVLRPVIAISIPVCLENILFQFGKMVTQTFAVPFGTNAMAVNGIANNVFTLLMVPGTTASNAAVPVVGRYIGMKEPVLAKRKTFQFLSLATVAAVAASLFIYAITPALARFYSTNEQVQTAIVSVCALCCLVYPVLWPAAFVLPSALRAAGDVRYTTMIAVVAMVVMRIGGGYLCAVVFKMGVPGIWLGMYLDWVMRIVCFGWRIRGDAWHQRSLV